MKVLLHAGDFGIADVRTVEKREEICHVAPMSARYT
jgi:hypothetical protein